MSASLRSRTLCKTTFAVAYEGWYLWLEIGDINRKFMRCDIEDVSFIADMREQTFTYPNKHVSWSTHHWYIVSDWKKPFEDNVASLSMCIDQLKQIQKKTKK